MKDLTDSSSLKLETNQIKRNQVYVHRNIDVKIVVNLQPVYFKNYI